MRSSIRQSFLYFVTVAFGQGLSFLLLPLVTRFLAPEEYGYYSLALVVTSLVAMGTAQWVTNVGLRLYVDAYGREATRGFFVSTSLLQIVLFMTVYGGALLVLAHTGSHLAPLRIMAYAGAARLLEIQYSYSTTLLRADQRATPFAVAEVTSGLIRVGATTAGLFLGFKNAEMLFVASGLAFFIASVYATGALWRGLLGTRLFDTKGLKELVRSGPASIPFSMSSWLERLADRLVLAYFAGPAAVGIYSVGYTVGERLLGTLVQAVFMVAWPNILNGWRDGGREAARAAIDTAQRIYVWITVGPALFLMTFGGVLMHWLAGESYQASAVVVPIVTAAMWVGGFGAYLNRQFELNKRYGQLSGITMVGATFNVVLNIVLIPRFGMAGAAFATLVNQSFNSAVFLVGRDRGLVRIQLRPLLAAVALSGLAWLVSRLAVHHDALAVGLFIVVYAAGALSALRGIDREELALGIPR